VAGWPLARVTDGLVGAVHLLDRLPGSGMAAPGIPAWLVLAGLGVLTLWVLAPWLCLPTRWVAVAAIIFAVLFAWRFTPAERGDTLTVRIFAVGDGTTSLITLPDGHTLVYDIGSTPPYDIERWTLGPILAQERIRRIDTVILSHANLDHYSGLPDLLEHRTVGHLVIAPHFERIGGARRIWDEIASSGVPKRLVVRGDRLGDTGDVAIEVLWPPAPDELTINRANDTSIVLRVSYAGVRVLLCGDAEEVAQNHLLETTDLAADVLVLPHHGGVDPTTMAFITAVNPRYCIRSSGQRDALTTNGLLDLVAGRTYYNTADDGAVEVRIAPDDLTVQPFRQRSRGPASRVTAHDDATADERR
jgi:competence protein ComEC